MNTPIQAFRCDEDGAPVIDDPGHLSKHLGHTIRPCYPKWWERWLLSWGWRP